MQNVLPSQVVNWAIEQKCVKKLEEQMDILGIPFRYEVQDDDGKMSTTKWTSLDGMFSKKYN